MSHIAELSNVVSRINNLANENEYGAVAKANAIPSAWRRRCEAILIAPRDGRYANEVKPEDIAVAKEIQSELASRYEAAGRAERAAELARIASELESLRAILPGLAAKAAIEAGQQARSIAAMATAEGGAA
ncbi:hypothetical protein ACVITL_002862 [Rhizobium pisi]